jgi:hypothetical protein
MKMEQTECSETLAFKIQTPVNCVCLFEVTLAVICLVCEPNRIIKNVVLFPEPLLYTAVPNVHYRQASGRAISVPKTIKVTTPFS